MSVVVGASSRIGRAVVTRLAFAGQNVVAIDSKSAHLESLEEQMKKVGGNVSCLPFEESEEATLSHASRMLDGHFTRFVYVPPDNTVKGHVDDSTTTDFNIVFAQRLTLPFRLIKSAVPHLKKNKDGSIVIINSSTAYTSFIDLGLFSAGSTALLSLSKALALSLAKDSIRVNTVMMSTVRGDGSNGIWDTQDETTPLSEMIPLGRLGSAADVAAAVQFLLSEKSRYTTGECLLLTGGMQLRL